MSNTGSVSVRDRAKWRAWLVPAVLALAIAGVITLASKRSRSGGAHCDQFLLDARAPDLDVVELDDQSVRALGGQALADILDSCSAIDEWTEYRWRLRVSTLLPDRPVDTIMDSGMPPAVVQQLERTCAGDFQEAIGEIQELPARWRGYAIFESCKFEGYGVLSSDDVDYVDPGYVADWRMRQLLLESGVPEPLANRYFIAILLATEISERAPGQVRLRAGGLEFDSRDGPLERVEHPIEREVIDHVFEASTLGEGCELHVSIAVSEPIGNLRWLLEDIQARPRGCSTPALTIAVSEREQLLRPLRATLEMPALELGLTAELEVETDVTGIAWRTITTERHPDVDEQGTNPAALAALLATLQPKSLRVHAKADAPGKHVVDLLRAADVWRARNRKPMDLWLVIEPDPA